MSHAQRITKQVERQNIHLVTGGRDYTGHVAWYYVQVDAQQRSRFQRVVKSGAISLTEYGTILQSGYGDAPPASIREYMKRQYGFEG